jgi:glutamine amidotransferase
MSTKIAVIDYGFGNIQSVANAIKVCGAEPVIINSARELSNFNGAILPGVGAFGPAISFLQSTGFYEAVKNYVSSGKMLYGTCLGFQLLFSRSYENGDFKGLGLIEGSVKKFPIDENLKIPHMGWNTVSLTDNSYGKKMFAKILNNENFYFVHSYYVDLKDISTAAAWTDYGIKFCSAIAIKNIWGSQFHPEKSGKSGLQIMKNFIEACK